MKTSTATRRRPPRAEDHLRLVYAIATQIHRLLGRGELDELVSYGTEGLMRAIHRFDPERGIGFSTFAYHRIRGAIWDGVRASCPVNGNHYRRIKALRSAPVHITSLEEIDPALLRAEEPPADAQCDANRMTRRLSAAVAQLPARERELLHRHYWNDQTLLAAGADLGFTKSWASRLHARALTHLRGTLSGGPR